MKRLAVVVGLILLARSASASPTPLSIELYDLWYCNENSGSICFTKTGSGRQLTLTNGAVFVPTDRLGHAVFLDGSNDFITSGLSTEYAVGETDPLNMGLCFNTTSFNPIGIDTLMGRIDSSDNGFALRTNDRGSGPVFEFHIGSAGLFRIVYATGVYAANLADGQTHCICGTSSGGGTDTMDIYIDNNIPRPLVSVLNTSGAPTSGRNFEIGGNSASPGNYFNGKINYIFFQYGTRKMTSSEVGRWMDFVKQQISLTAP